MEALFSAIDDHSVTCIKLAPGVYRLTEPLGGMFGVSHRVALVAKDGGVSLDGGGWNLLLRLNKYGDVALFNLVLRNGYNQDVRPTRPSAALLTDQTPHRAL